MGSPIFWRRLAIMSCPGMGSNSGGESSIANMASEKLPLIVRLFRKIGRYMWFEYNEPGHIRTFSFDPFPSINPGGSGDSLQFGRALLGNELTNLFDFPHLEIRDTRPFVGELGHQSWGEREPIVQNWTRGYSAVALHLFQLVFHLNEYGPCLYRT